MRVIVGKPSKETPTLRSTLHYATLNPYWYVPPFLARTMIAPKVLEQGIGYLHAQGYELVTEFSEDAQVLAPESIDWKEVAAGNVMAFVRQRPGPANSMGQIKFNLASAQGIFLHDTPQKELFEENERRFSNGCVRLEDAPRLARWLLGETPRTDSDDPDQHVRLPKPVPIAITYLDEGTQVQLAGLR
jgi:murein L,D-transpeptidase YcbB/YkuD